MNYPRIAVCAASVALFVSEQPASAAWTLSADPIAMRALPSQWQDYFGIHYSRISTYDGPWFKTVRSYGAANMGLPQDGSGNLNTSALTGTPMTGPFLGQSYSVALRDIHNWTFNTPGFDVVIPEALAYGLTSIYPTPNLFFLPQPVNQDLAYVTLRRVYEAFPTASSKILFQWGNEVNAHNYDPAQTTDPTLNTTSQVPFYAGPYFARGIEALQRVSLDLYGDSQRIPVVSGSFANIRNVASRDWMRSVLNYQITSTYAPTLAGSSIWQHVDILTVHYPFAAGEGGGAVMQAIWDEWIAPGKIPALWVTEDHGNSGLGPSTILARSMRYLDWIAGVGANATKTRLCWWGTNDTTDPGGQAIEAINFLGRNLSGSEVRERFYSLDGAEVFLVSNGVANSLSRLTVTVLPPGAEEQNNPAITPVDPGTITIAIPPGTLATTGPAVGVQYFTTQPSQTWTPSVSVSGQNVQIAVGRAISSPVLLTVPVSYVGPKPPVPTRMSATAVKLDWESHAGWSYQVQYGSTLTSWSSVGTPTLATGPSMTWTDDGTQTGSPPVPDGKRFYRLLVSY